MSAVIFVGPSFRREDIAGAHDFVCLPPAAQGDIYRAGLQRPPAIGVIDGYFFQVPAVWHKEILWALSQGIHVFGSASMGALRAAELHSFGMRGVGRIFEAFRDGELEDDDEVAIEHGPAELGYVNLSEPMVNIRATLAQAQTAGVVSPAARRRLETTAKSTFFAKRSWPALLGADGANGVEGAEAAALRDWLPNGYVDQKRADGLEMLAVMRETMGGAEPFRASFRFERTHFWEEFTAANTAATATRAFPPAQDRILDEVRLEGPEAYRKIQTRALLRMIAAEGLAKSDKVFSTGELRATFGTLRSELGLYAQADVERWMSQNDLDQAALERLLVEQESVSTLRQRTGPLVDLRILDELRLSGAYPRLAERARRKDKALAKFASLPNRFDFRGLNETALRLWFFEQRLHGSIPDSLADFARGLGFERPSDFDAAIRKEWMFLQLDAHDHGA